MDESSVDERAGRKPVRVPESLGSGIDEDVARIIGKAQVEGLALTGEGGLLPGMIKRRSRLR